MTKRTTTTNNSSEENTVSTTNDVKQRGRNQKRKKTYERVRELHIPQELKQYFLADDYELRLERWALNGEEDYRNLYSREREGYEFVTIDEIPEEFRPMFVTVDTRQRKGLITINDLCLMKVDVDLRQARRDFYAQETENEVKASDVYTLFKQNKFKDLGTKSSISTKEPSFQE